MPPPGLRDVLLLTLLLTLMTSTVLSLCPKECKCSDGHQVWTNCSAVNLTSVPLDIPRQTVLLDLSWNAISSLQDLYFQSFNNLHELNLTGNNLQKLSSNSLSGLTNLRSLSLQSNRLHEVPTDSLRSVPNLETLRLNDNLLAKVETGGLSAVSGKLRLLWLNDNLLREVPVEALNDLTHLEALNLANNEITQITDHTFHNLSNLMILVLKQNRISEITPKAFEGLTSIKVLEINDNELMQVTPALSSITTLKELTIAGNLIQHLPDEAFRDNKELALIEMGGNPIASVGHRTFSHLPNLKKLTLSDVRQLTKFPDLTGTLVLEHLRLDRGQLRSVDSQICVNSPHLKSLSLKSNRITTVPILRGCADLKLLDLSYNAIVSVEGALFMHQTKLIDLFLSNNLISYVSRDAWLGLESLYVLALDSNKIQDIHPEAFVPLKELRDLNLASNVFPSLPSKGLQSVRQLKTFNNRNLKEFPPPELFPRVQTLALSYAYHCCAFLPPAGPYKPTARTPASLQETIVWLQKEDVDMSVWSANFTDIWPGYENFSSKFEEFASELWKAFGRDYAIPDNIAQYAEEYFEDYKSVYNSDENLLSRYPIKCLPEPGPFMPCEDLFGWWTLRCGVWVVFLLAMLGNGVVVVVLLFGRSKLDVPRFLVCNLAMADFFMGVYLGILAVVDASTLGEYKVYAIPWQLSAGCQIAGFLGVLSSELSVYTLSVITLERNYAITHAMHLNKRLSLKHAGYIMSCGWVFALIMALLPLAGVSDYRKFAVCLPFEIDDVWSLAYVVFLILINGVAFLILMGCYLKMYCAIRGSQAWNSNDSRIAKRMALLVFTDFICWAPIAFFSLTAVFGLELISLEEAKVFTIFVLPLNSCCNPFLYAIFTKQFKKDCVLICKRIEESRVTRGIGRCRHSSNFSNRHTPANTNSAADRKSGSDQTPHCQCAQSTKANNNTNSDSRAKLVRSDGGGAADAGVTGGRRRRRRGWKAFAFFYLLCHEEDEREPSSNDYTYAIAQIQKSVEDGHKRASSISSENFSSRSDSWRQGNVPMRLLERGSGGGGSGGGGGNRRNSWSVTRKQSQDSNLSCSRQDSSTSTFRMSRSSVSSDNSNPPAGGRTTFSSLRERPSNPLNGEAACAIGMTQRPFGSVREKPPPTTETAAQVRCYPRGTMMTMMSKDKPKLCRQTAVDDPTCARTHRAAIMETRPFQRSPPFGQPRDGVCPSCSSRKDTSPPLTFKNKELEEKFNCFYNQLAETSHEDSSEVSKEEQGILSTESKGDGTNESSLQESDVGRPDIEIINPASPQPPEDHEDDGLTVEAGTSSSATCLGRTDPQLQHLNISADNIRGHKSHSMTSIDNEPQDGADGRLTSGRKTASDNSMKKLSLKSLPAMLRSFSSQRFGGGGHNIKVRSQMQLRDVSAERLPSSRSEAVIHLHHGGSGDWKVTLREKRGVQSLVEAADSDGDDVFCDGRRPEQRLLLFGNKEDVPLIDQDVDESQDLT